MRERVAVSLGKTLNATSYLEAKQSTRCDGPAWRKTCKQNSFCAVVLWPGMWKRKLEAVKFLWKREPFEERSWKRKRTQKHLIFWGAGSGSIFHKT